MAVCLRSRDDNAAVEVLDAAYWVKGCSSLGNMRIAVLCGIGEGKRQEFALMDLKQAVAARAPAHPENPINKDNAERVVEGAMNLSPQFGMRMIATKFLGNSVVVRELLPQDLKLEVETLTIAEAMRCARYLAGVVGAAHGRQMDKATRHSWVKTLGRHQTKSLDAPSWLWSSVVALIGTHEMAYLEHCRRHASQMHKPD